VIPRILDALPAWLLFLLFILIHGS